MPSPPTIVHLVPHTHWDREWYLPFQAFRMRLVGLLDGLLDAMEADERLRFTLDGQLATVDDYLEIRPEAAPRIAALVRSGRLAVGPWLILMDEFLVSGETIVRNLELGIRRATELGRVMNVGYLPDMFGHIAQMPQILARAGIVDAVVWRGVPAAVDRHAFGWHAPDGSEVRCEYLWGGYGNARDVFDDPDRIPARLETYVRSVAPLFGVDDVLAMYGEDHSIPLQGYADLVDEFNASGTDLQIRVATLDEYLAATRDRSRPQIDWTGELRSGSRANILMGVVSNRVDVRAAAAEAERLLWRTAEPILALHGTTWPERYLELAARRIVENSAHDSICACSADAVVAQVLVRFAEASQIAAGLARATLDGWAAERPRGAWIAFNPSPFARTELVEIELAADGPRGDRPLLDPAGRTVTTQELRREQETFDDREVATDEVATYLSRRIHGRELYTRQLNGWTLAGPDRRDLTIHVDRVPDPPVLDVDRLVEAIAAAADAEPGARWRLRVVENARRVVLAAVTAPALGLTSIGPGDAATRVAGAPAGRRPSTEAPPVTAGPRQLDNGLVRLVVTDDGTLTVTAAGHTIVGVGRLVDGGDVGDTYNHAPPPTDLLVDRPLRVDVRCAETGPLRGVLEIARRYAWPRGLAANLTCRSGATVEVDVLTRVELRVGDPLVRLTVDYDNQAVDHRLRLHVPLPEPADRSYAEGQFAIVERGLTSEAGHGEYPLPTQPADAFVAAGGLAVLTRHVVEYELVDDGRELAVTLLRATGLISRDAHPYRDEPAGPVVPVPGAQLIGARTFELGLLVHGRGAPGPAVVAAAEAYRMPFLVVPGGGPTDAPLAEQAGLAIDGDGVVLTSLRRHDGWLEARLVAERPSPVEARIVGRIATAREVDLIGRPLDPLPVEAGSVRVTVGPWQIRTIQLR